MGILISTCNFFNEYGWRTTLKKNTTSEKGHFSSTKMLCSTDKITWSKIFTRIIQLYEILFQELLAWLNPIFAKMDMGNRKWKGAATWCWSQVADVCRRNSAQLSLYYHLQDLPSGVNKPKCTIRIKITFLRWFVPLQTNLDFFPLYPRKDEIGM